MDERFVQLRDSNGLLRATIAHYRPDPDGLVKYAVAVVSPSEPRSIISPRTGCAKTASRLESSTEIYWKPYGHTLKFQQVHTHGKVSAYSVIQKKGFHKVGWMSASKFKRSMNHVREVIRFM